MAKTDEIAREFHETYERLAPKYGYQTRKESAVPWNQVPERNRRLMQAVVADLVERGIIADPDPRPSIGCLICLVVALGFWLWLGLTFWSNS